MASMSLAKVQSEYMHLVRRFPLVPIRNDAQYERAVKVMKNLAYRRSSLSRGESNYLTVLGHVMAHYEAQLPRLGTGTTPVEALRYLMEVNGLKQADLTPFVGHKSNLSAFLNGRRDLSKTAAMRLADRFKVSPALFLPKTKWS